MLFTVLHTYMYYAFLTILTNFEYYMYTCTKVYIYLLFKTCIKYRVVAAFLGMQVSSAKHGYV